MKNLTKDVAKFFDGFESDNWTGELDEYLKDLDYDLYTPERELAEDPSFIVAVVDSHNTPFGVFMYREQYPKDNENRYEVKQLAFASDYSERIQALAKHLGLGIVEMAEIEEDSDTLFSVGREEYLVLTDDEADQTFSEYLDNYIDECVLTEIPENLRGYFDYEAFKRDVQLSDGRGPSLASYDGEENEEKVNETYYFIYRTN